MKINTPQNWIAMAAISKLISILIQRLDFAGVAL
jgi:hypothetical protein